MGQRRTRRLVVPGQSNPRARKHRVRGGRQATGSFLEVDDNYPGALFNTTVLIGPGGVLSKYRKINTWIPWEVHTSPHDLPDYAENPFPVVDTELGRLGVATGNGFSAWSGHRGRTENVKRMRQLCVRR